MAFNINNWGRSSVTYNLSAPNFWTYTGIENGENDSLVDIKGIDYFQPVATSFIRINDIIEIVGNDGQELIRVDTVNPVSLTSNTVLPLSQIFVGDGLNHSTPRIMSGDVNIQFFGITTIQPGVVSKDKLAANVRPEAIIVFSDSFVSATTPDSQIFAASGVVSGDLVFVQVSNFNGTVARIIEAVASTDEIIVEWDVNPGVAITFSAQVTRAT